LSQMIGTLLIGSVKKQTTRKNTIQVWSTGECGANQEPSGVRMSILLKEKQRDCSCVVFLVELEANCMENK